MEEQPRDEKKEIGRLEKERDELHKVIGEKEMDIDFLKKLEETGTAAVRADIVSPDNEGRSIKKPCELLGVSRNAYYYESRVSEFKQTLMRRIDGLYTENPAAGQRSLQSSLLRRYGVRAGRKLIRHLMDIMQIASLAPKLFLSVPCA